MGCEELNQSELGRRGYNLFSPGCNSHGCGVDHQIASLDDFFLHRLLEAQAYRLSNDFTQALFFYKSFLRNLPAAPNHVEVEQRIAEMQDALDKAKTTATATPNGPVGPGEELPTGGDPDPKPEDVKIPDPADTPG